MIIPHFDKYPLISQKRSDYILFKNIVELMDKGEHLKEDSLIKIVNLRAALNRGLSDKLKLSFPEGTKIEKYKINPPLNIDYNWIAGFFTGEAYFSVTTRLLLEVSTAQRSIDELLMNSLMNTLKCGIVSEHSKGVTLLTVSRFKDIYNKIISLFNEYKIMGIKGLDYQDFCRIALLCETSHRRAGK